MNISSISFGRKIPRYTCQVQNKTTGEYVPATIYEYNCKDERDYEEIKKLDRRWLFKDNIAHFMEVKHSVQTLFNEKSNDSFFSMQVGKDIIGIAQVCTLNGISNIDYITTKPRNEYNRKYFHFLFRSNNYIEEYYRLGRGIVADLWTTRYSEMRNLCIPLPPLSEQEKIVEYLEYKTKIINAYVAERERELRLLNELKESEIANVVTRGVNPNVKMKDSGIPWIGMIPEHWEIIRIKTAFSVISGNGFPIDIQGNKNDELPFCKVSDLNGIEKTVSNANNYISKETALSMKINIIPPYSILFSKIGEALKRNHRKLNSKSCCIDNNCSALVKHSSLINIDYAYYLTRCIDMAWFDNGGAIPCANIKKFMATHIPLPPLDEQQAIVAYIEEKCEKIEMLIGALEEEIARLKEYKQSLIADCVTGKIKV